MRAVDGMLTEYKRINGIDAPVGIELFEDIVVRCVIFAGYIVEQETGDDYNPFDISGFLVQHSDIVSTTYNVKTSIYRHWFKGFEEFKIYVG